MDEPAPVAAGAALEERADFVAELVRQRMLAELSQGALGNLMGYDRTYVNKVERGAMEPTSDFARRADETLKRAGDLLRRWEEYDRAKHKGAPRTRPATIHPAEATGVDLVVEHDEAWLRRASGMYHLHMRKTITNVGEAPISRFFMRVAVDRFPSDVARSNEHYRRDPLTVTELNLDAHCGAQQMDFEVAQDRDASKEIWLLFRRGQRRFPLYPGQQATLDYTFHVPARQWGNYFQRSVRLPTKRISVHLEFPDDFGAAVWGLETSPTAGQRSFVAPITSESAADAIHFHWSTPRPPLAARYRLEWSFAGDHQEDLS
jgi:transcriptional regulator with XRE-family HTH domain